ncbi:hypothetical protein PT2222_50135 [Paraburkholderia tropica]
MRATKQSGRKANGAASSMLRGGAERGTDEARASRRTWDGTSKARRHDGGGERSESARERADEGEAERARNTIESSDGRHALCNNVLHCGRRAAPLCVGPLRARNGVPIRAKRSVDPAALAPDFRDRARMTHPFDLLSDDFSSTFLLRRY